MKFKIVLVFVMLLAIVGFTVYNTEGGPAGVASKSLFKGLRQSNNYLDIDYETMMVNLQNKREGVYLIGLYSVDTEEVAKVLDKVLEETKRKAHFIDIENALYTTEMADVISSILNDNDRFPVVLVIDQKGSIRIHGANVGGEELQGRVLSESESFFLKNEYKSLFE